MAKKALVDSILKLYSKLGGNVGEVLGTRSNISFLGTGKSPEGFIDSTINIDAIGALGKNKVLEELKSSIGYLTANKLNDIQAGKLYENMLKVDEVFNPKITANITDLATGTENLTPGGLEYLRLTGIRGRKQPYEMADESKTVFGLKDYETAGWSDAKKRIVELEEKLGRLNPNVPGFRERAKPLVDEIEALQLQLKNETGLMSRIEGQMENIKATSSKLDDAMKEYENIYKSADDLPPPGSRGGADDIAAPVQQYSNEIDALETMVKNRAGNDFIAGYVDDIYKNAGATSSVDVPKKRAAARMFLNSMLKKETDLLPPGKGGTLESVVSEADYKFITEGGGGALGDPLVLVKKYFGDTIAKRIPLDTRTEVIDTFVDNVRFAKDRSGFATDDPRFNPDDIPEFKHGGLAKILEV